jgi:hypothetical protein
MLPFKIRELSAIHFLIEESITDQGNSSKTWGLWIELKRLVGYLSI